MLGCLTAQGCSQKETEMLLTTEQVVTGLFPDDDEYRYSLWLVCEATNSALGGTMSVME